MSQDEANKLMKIAATVSLPTADALAILAAQERFSQYNNAAAVRRALALWKAASLELRLEMDILNHESKNKPGKGMEPSGSSVYHQSGAKAPRDLF